MKDNSMADPELDDLLGNDQVNNFVIEQVVDSFIVTPIEEMTPEEREEVIEDDRIDIQHPTYEEWEKEDNKH